MITTVTLNVSVDKLYSVDRFETGKVTRVKECFASAGGKGLNVSRTIYILGEKVTATGFLGGNNGRYVEEMLKRDGIQNDFVHIGGESRCCINVVEHSGKSTELLEPGAPVSEREKADFLEKYKELVCGSSIVTLSGSLPPGCGPDFYATLIQIAKSYQKPVILDTSGEGLKRGIQACPTLIKPNKDEIQSLLGIEVGGREQAVQAAEKLHRGGIPYVIISMGKDGAVMACAEGTFEGTPPAVKVENTVSCGDSMIGAFAVAFLRKYPAQSFLQLGVAVSSAAAMCRKTGFFYLTDLKKTQDRVTVQKIDWQR